MVQFIEPKAVGDSQVPTHAVNLERREIGSRMAGYGPSCFAFFPVLMAHHLLLGSGLVYRLHGTSTDFIYVVLI